MRSILHSVLASMSIIGLPAFLRPEEMKTQEIIYHFTAFITFVMLFRPRMEYKNNYGVTTKFPTVSFFYRKQPDQPIPEFDHREVKYNINLALFTLVGSFIFKVLLQLQSVSLTTWTLIRGQVLTL